MFCDTAAELLLDPVSEGDRLGTFRHIGASLHVIKARIPKPLEDTLERPPAADRRCSLETGEQRVDTSAVNALAVVLGEVEPRKAGDPVLGLGVAQVEPMPRNVKAGAGSPAPYALPPINEVASSRRSSDVACAAAEIAREPAPRTTCCVMTSSLTRRRRTNAAKEATRARRPTPSRRRSPARSADRHQRLARNGRRARPPSRHIDDPQGTNRLHRTHVVQRPSWQMPCTHSLA